jgi:hypothetical protein
MTIEHLNIKLAQALTRLGIVPPESGRFHLTISCFDANRVACYRENDDMTSSRVWMFRTLDEMAETLDSWHEIGL